MARCMGVEPHEANSDDNVSRESPTHDCRAVAGWLAFGRAGVCIWFMLSMIHTHAQHSERGFRFSGISLGTNFVSVLLMSAAAAASRFVPAVGIALLVTAAVVDVVHIPVLWTCAPFYRRSFVPIDANLAAERFGLIYLISLEVGETHGTWRATPFSYSVFTFTYRTHATIYYTHSSVQGNIDPGEPVKPRFRATAIMILGVFLGLFFQTAFFSLYDLRADRAKKHALEVSVLRSWAILHVTSALALLAALVAATLARLSLLGRFTPTDRMTLCLTLALKIVLFSGSNRLYLRHVRVAYGWIADAVAIAALGLIGGLSHDTLPDDVLFVGLLTLVWAALVLARGVVLPVRLTEEGLEEVLNIAEDQMQKRRRKKMRYRLLGDLPFVRRQRKKRTRTRSRSGSFVSATSGGSGQQQYV